jgi:PAS domain S-box-containing protein
MAAEPLRILLLEDNPADAELNLHALQKAGVRFDARRVERRDEFVSALEEFQPDVVIADFRLPDFDGLQALELVRTLRPYLPFIFVSGALGEEAAIETLHRGANDYLLKDRINRLPQAVNRSLAEVHERRLLQDVRKALEASEASFRAIVETSSDWIWRTDEAGYYKYSSPSVLGLLGYRADEVTGMRLFDLVSDDELPQVESQFRKLMSDKTSFALVEWSCRHKDGHRVFFETSGTPNLDAEGQLIGFYGASRDITERMRLAEELELLRLRQQKTSEREAISRMAHGARTDNEARTLSLRDQDLELFKNMVEHFGKTLDMALEQRIKRVQHPISAQLRKLGESLGAVRAGPRDVIDLYVNSIQIRSQNSPSQKIQAYTEEGRLLALELMGNLVAYYRNRLNATA